jgi:hypothetical protein
MQVYYRNNKRFYLKKKNTFFLFFIYLYLAKELFCIIINDDIIYIILGTLHLQSSTLIFSVLSKIITFQHYFTK